MGDRRLCHTSGVDEHTYRLPTPSGRVIRTAVRPLDMAVGTIHGQPMALGGIADKASRHDEDQFRPSYFVLALRLLWDGNRRRASRFARMITSPGSAIIYVSRRIFSA